MSTRHGRPHEALRRRGNGAFWNELGLRQALHGNWVSLDSAQRDYAAVIDPASMTVDTQRTLALRDARRRSATSSAGPQRVERRPFSESPLAPSIDSLTAK